jgi:hypothetical protein
VFLSLSVVGLVEKGLIDLERRDDKSQFHVPFACPGGCDGSRW